MKRLEEGKGVEKRREKGKSWGVEKLNEGKALFTQILKILSRKVRKRIFFSFFSLPLLSHPPLFPRVEKNQGKCFRLEDLKKKFKFSVLKYFGKVNFFFQSNLTRSDFLERTKKKISKKLKKNYLSSSGSKKGFLSAFRIFFFLIIIPVSYFLIFYSLFFHVFRFI